MNVSGTSNRQDADDSSRAFWDYFRCPQEFASFRFAGKPSAQEGFFLFRSIRCFGRTSALIPNNESLLGQPSGETIPLCFSPTEVVDNLRRERYLATSKGQRRLRNLYYFLRPVLPFAIRKLLQQTLFRWRNRSFPRWPVDCSVEQIFEALMERSIQETQVTEVPFIWFWPEGKNCAAMMTHDVEQKSGADSCDTLMDLDDSFGIKA